MEQDSIQPDAGHVISRGFKTTKFQCVFSCGQASDGHTQEAPILIGIAVFSPSTAGNLPSLWKVKRDRLPIDAQFPSRVEISVFDVSKIQKAVLQGVGEMGLVSDTILGPPSEGLGKNLIFNPP